MEKENKTKEILDPMLEIENEILEELKKEKKLNLQTLNKEGIRRGNFILTILQRMLGKLMFKLKIRIVVLWDDKELFTYEIPKN